MLIISPGFINRGQVQTLPLDATAFIIPGCEEREATDAFLRQLATGEADKNNNNKKSNFTWERKKLGADGRFVHICHRHTSTRAMTILEPPSCYRAKSRQTPPRLCRERPDGADQPSLPG